MILCWTLSVILTHAEGNRQAVEHPRWIDSRWWPLPCCTAAPSLWDFTRIASLYWWFLFFFSFFPITSPLNLQLETCWFSSLRKIKWTPVWPRCPGPPMYVWCKAGVKPRSDTNINMFSGHRTGHTSYPSFISVSAIEYLDQSKMGNKGLIWLILLGYSP